MEVGLPCEVDDFCDPSLKMCTVSCAELTANNDDTALKFIEYLRARDVRTRMTAPFSDNEVRMDPVELMERKEMGALCAWISVG